MRLPSARPCPAAEDGTAQVSVRGAVLVQAIGVRALTAGDREALHPELVAVLNDPPPQPGRAPGRGTMPG